MIYLDNQATTQTDPKVAKVIHDTMINHFGNAHSRHKIGWNAHYLVEDARKQIADAINAKPEEIVFTSGATEANNIAIKGISWFYGDNKKKKHIITSAMEHKCVLEVCRYLERNDFTVTYLKPDQEGIIHPEQIKNAIRDDTLLVSIIAVQNEIGTIQDIKTIGKICRERDVFFHTDGAQAFGKINLDVVDMNIDLMSISGHKMYGPKGIGALYVRKKPQIRLHPLIHGGGQERNFRSGTLPVPLIVGLGEATKIALERIDIDNQHVTKLWSLMYDEILPTPEVSLNGSSTQRYFGNINICFRFIEGEAMMMKMGNVACSSGSACTSSDLKPSYVLHSIGLPDEDIHSSIRFGFGRFTTIEEVQITIEKIKKSVHELREMSPLWEMFNNGIDLSTIKWTEH